MPTPPLPTMSAYQPSLRDRTATWLNTVLGDSFTSQNFTRNLLGSTGIGGSGRTGLVDYLPGPGTAYQLDEGGAQVGAGHPYIGGANIALAAMPIPAAAKVVKKGAQAAVKAAQKATQAAQKTAVEAIEKRAAEKGVSLSIQQGERGLTVSKIVVPEDARGKGLGTSVMKDVLDYADQTGQRVMLTPDASFGGSVSRLKGFYGRQGFVPNTGRSRDLSISETMYREPQAPNPVLDNPFAAPEAAPPAPTRRASAKEPSLVSAVRHNGKVYTGDTHMDALAKVPEDQRRAATLDGNNRGFLTERGRFLDRFKGADYARAFDLFSPDAPNWARTAPELIGENLRKPAPQVLDNPFVPQQTLPHGLTNPEGSSAANPFVTAYHGSPHAFDRFDLSKIGTGEGAQAFGHGLYFAENEDVAHGYKLRTSQQNADLTFDGKPLRESKDFWDMEDRLNAAGDWRSVKAFKELNSWLRQGYPKGDALKIMRGAHRNDAEMMAALDGIEKRVGVEASPGHMYQVRINADPEHFLDWDAPLSRDYVEQRLSAFPEVVEGDAKQRAFLGPDNGYTGRAAYAKAAGWRTGVDLSPPNAAEVSQRFSEAGIPGIRYKDAGSRGAEGGTRNYVVFNDQLVDITGRNGAPPPVSADFVPRTPDVAPPPVFDPTTGRVLRTPDIIDHGGGFAPTGPAPTAADVAAPAIWRNPFVFQPAGRVPIVTQAGEAGLPLGGLEQLNAQHPNVFGAYHNVKPGIAPDALAAGYSGADLPPVRTITPADLQGADIISLTGDRTRAGGDLLGYHGQAFGTPVQLQGGPDFGRWQAAEGSPAVWASEPNPVTQLRNSIRSSLEQGRDVYGVYTPMGPGALDQTTMMAETLTRMIEAGKIKRADLAAFDKQMKTLLPGLPSIRDPAAVADALSRRTMGDRKTFVEAMDKAPWLKAGFPDVGAARMALTDPNLLNVPAGASGYRVVQFTPDTLERINAPVAPHGSYSEQMAGKNVGAFDELVPFNMLFSDWAGGRRAAGKTPGTDLRSFDLSKPTQTMTPELVDRLMSYQEAARRRR